MISKETVQHALKTQAVGHKIFVFESLDSTNTCLKTLAETDAEEGTVVVTDFQTEGRGRRGRHWEAEQGTNLLFSVLFRPDLPKDSASLMTFFAAAAVARAVERVVSRPVECKWPNDLLLGGKKFCGILLENSLQKNSLAYSVVGVGINVNQKEFPIELQSKATSLALETGNTVDREKLLQRLLQEMDMLYKALREGQFDQITSEWNSRCTMFGRTVAVEENDQRITGTAIRLAPDGGLLMETPGGKKTIYTGEILVLP